MVRIIPLLIFAFLAQGCSKENRIVVRGTVILQEGCAPGSYLVRLTAPDPKWFSFLCDRETSIISSSIYNCGNAVFIIDMPSRFLQEGKKIRFSLWADKGSYCFSSNLAPHFLEVQDLSEE